MIDVYFVNEPFPFFFMKCLSCDILLGGGVARVIDVIL
jgi:hypothetical protein